MTIQFPSGTHREKDFVRIPQRKVNEPPGEYFISKQSLKPLHMLLWSRSAAAGKFRRAISPLIF